MDDMQMIKVRFPSMMQCTVLFTAQAAAQMHSFPCSNEPQASDLLHLELYYCTERGGIQQIETHMQQLPTCLQRKHLAIATPCHT